MYQMTEKIKTDFTKEAFKRMNKSIPLLKSFRRLLKIRERKKDKEYATEVFKRSNSGVK